MSILTIDFLEVWAFRTKGNHQSLITWRSLSYKKDKEGASGEASEPVTFFFKVPLSEAQECQVRKDPLPSSQSVFSPLPKNKRQKPGESGIGQYGGLVLWNEEQQTISKQHAERG